MDAQSYSRMLSYVVCELTMPVKRHVYNTLAYNQSSINHHFITAAARAAKSCKLSNFKSHQSKQKLSQSKKLLFEMSMSQDHVTDLLHAQDYKYNCDQITQEENKQSPTQLELKEGGQNPTSSKELLAEQNGLTPEKKVFEDPRPLDSAEPCNELFDFHSDPLLLCSEADFKTMFRMTRSSFQNLLVLMSNEDMEPIDDVPLYKKLLMVLWLMGNSGSYSDAAQVFNVTEETTANCFFDVCATLYNRSDSFIKWPSFKESSEIASRIEKTYAFPGVVGILGCHYFSISIPKESLSRRDHFNAKQRTYCIAVQIVCDDQLVIRDIFPGLPGGMPVAQVLRDSPLCEQLTSKEHSNQLVEPHKHILARAEYPQLTSMLTPYGKPGKPLSKDEEEFNKLHENVCQLVDQTFQMLKDRFLTLKLLDPEVATMMLVTACVLHNICIEKGDLFEV